MSSETDYKFRTESEGVGLDATQLPHDKYSWDLNVRTDWPLL